MKEAANSARHLSGSEPSEPEFDVRETEAIEAVLDGDANAFEFIVGRYERSIYGTLIGLLGDPEEAADAAQETFVKAYTNLGRYNPTRPFAPWIHRIARNTAVSRLRSARRRPNAPLSPDQVDPGPSPRQQAQRSEAEGNLHAAVESLPGEARRLFEMHYAQEMTVEQIGDLTGRRPNTVAVALHRLRAKLRQLIMGNESDERCAQEEKLP